MAGKERGDDARSPNFSDTQGKGGALRNKERAKMELDGAHDEGNRRWETTGEERPSKVA